MTGQTQIEDWGTTPNGEIVQRIELSSNEARCSVITLGATWQSFYLAGMEESLVLGYQDLDGYLNDNASMGCSIGPIANRISEGRIAKDGAIWQLPLRQPGFSLHSGAIGFQKRNWKITQSGDGFVQMTLDWTDPTGGFPGELRVEAAYLLEGAQLTLNFKVVPDRPTPLSLANHAYFNLSGTGTIDDHELQLFAYNFTETDTDLMPTGRRFPLEDMGIRPGKAFSLKGRALDDNMCLADAPRTEPEEAAIVRGAKTALTFATTEPGVQVYTADNMRNTPTGHHGGPYDNRAGFCLEAQNWPDSPNKPGFPDPWFTPERPYYAETLYAFGKA